MANKLIDLTGRRFGRLVVIGRDEHNADHRGQPKWLCKCDCGEKTSVVGYSLRRGDTTSCGCLAKELSSARRKGKIKHGESNSRLYRIWAGMKQRCSNSRNPDFKDYGKRGIAMCMEWASDYIAFRDWALSSGYQDNLTIDRIDVNSDYCPENCRWATVAEQAENTRRTIRIALNGETHTLKEWSAISGTPYSAIKTRLSKNGVTPDILRPSQRSVAADTPSV